MAKEKHFVFSARTTEEGLRLLNGVREERKIGWDDLVIDAVCDRYGLDRLAVAPPKKEKPAKGTVTQPAATEQEQPTSDAPPKKKGKGSKK